MKKFSTLLIVILLITLAFQNGISQTALNSSVEIPGDAPDYHSKLFGDNIFIFNPKMNTDEIQTLIDSIYVMQSSRGSQFNSNRFAILFQPGKYNLDIKVGYYMHIIGLGESPEDVVITGAVRSKSTNRSKHVLTNFWRAAENLTVIPTVEDANVWGVSQAAPLRRIYVKGDLQLHDNGYASGGFLAESKVDGTVLAGGQQQWFTRNSELNQWKGGAWNVLFLGVDGAPSTNWPDGPVTTIDNTPAIREKPYFVFKDGHYFVELPQLKKQSSGISWTAKNTNTKSVPLKDFYIVKEGCSAAKINSELQQGKNLLFTPGIYQLDESIKVTRPGTILLGMGMATLVPLKGNKALEIADVDNVTVAGFLIDAGETPSETLVQVGEAGSSNDHSDAPSFLFDVFIRVGGAVEGSAESCLTINSSNVYVDHTWLWRADHGRGVAWDKNTCNNGLIVNGNDVTIYGLFNEHFLQYQTLWNGNGGNVYFYQCEMPYDPPSVEEWSHNGTKGYASYKVSDDVKTHEAWGIGIYCYFPESPIIVDNAIETPPSLEDDIHHKVIFWLNGNKDSRILHIINGKGEGVSPSDRKSVMK